ncbi:hypothetical protein EMIHUDRAFT_455818 [Emiliania huxleyi CCMP1516]|uniref:Sulfotransferase domain-containing protein n=2 Tax=Emiliania huxleyi TaxID=2903 RepID=A0A0D3KCC7_EMIH1|nr:hypothetical protein EMIHUDRAFT_455818 [Emiliania huxleyi CCMP1516]EOD33412.1 hypothetical protein EMIHUDRAFT_455818 [Emiliania huxleyi CCMP1516]|eukprot:XP_005785841.1 hypothetical protein EMIHUDRAFT_455818 [Emiliania huxleyi CCMP1516]
MVRWAHAEHERIGRLSAASSLVDCGSHLAPSCADCERFRPGERDGGCGGVCVRSGEACVPVLDPPEQSFVATSRMRSHGWPGDQSPLLLPAWGESAAASAARAAWLDGNSVDAAALSLFELRLRGASLSRAQVRAARVFGNDHGVGSAAAAVQGPADSLVFLHIAKCGGTSFNGRLTSLRRGDGDGCACARDASRPMHNGRGLAASVASLGTAWLCEAVSRQRLGPLSNWGGVHSPLRVVQSHVMFAARLAGERSKAAGLRYVTMLREPLARFLSEFYENYNGWEWQFGTPPRVRHPCSELLAAREAAIAARGIDRVSKGQYDSLFDAWISCPKNMAADRQSRALTHAGANRRKGFQLRRQFCGGGERVGESRWHTLLQFSFFGLNEARCATEKLFEAQFGLRFANDAAGRGSGKHKVAKLTFEELSESQRERVAALNANDLLLYDEAVAVFRERLRWFGIPENAKRECPNCPIPPAAQGLAGRAGEEANRSAAGLLS